MSVLGLPGASSAAVAGSLRRVGPIGLVRLGAWVLFWLVPASRPAVLLTLIGATAESAWILWLRLHLFGREPGRAVRGSVHLTLPPFGYATLFLGAVTAGLLLTRRGASVPDDSCGGVRVPGAPGGP